MQKFTKSKPSGREKWDRVLGRRLVFSADGVKRYEKRFGVSLSRPLLKGWIRKGHIRRVGRALKGHSSVLYEADLAYCVEVHAWRIAVGMPKTVPLLAEDGSPAFPAHKSPAEVTRDYRRRKALGISLRPRKRRKLGNARSKRRT